jgi:DNA-binding response OmpR family regulator
LIAIIGKKMPSTILIVEDNPEIAELLRLHLSMNGYETEHAGTGQGALAAARETEVDLIILDIMLPGPSGLDICRILRSEGIATPVLMLTAKSTETDRVIGLELGADDYLTKPFSIPELLARVKAILRRVELDAKPGSDLPDRVRVGGLEIDVGQRRVEIGGKAIELTAREFDLLHHFAAHPGRVFTRQQLLDSVWGYGHDGYEHTVNSHINRLRAKIEADPAKPDYVLTVWGVGYKFNSDLESRPKDTG